MAEGLEKFTEVPVEFFKDGSAFLRKCQRPDKKGKLIKMIRDWKDPGDGAVGVFVISRNSMLTRLFSEPASSLTYYKVSKTS